MSESTKRISLGKGFNGGTQVTIYGDTFAELLETLTPIYGADAATALLTSAFADLQRNYTAPPAVEAQAVQNVQQAFPGTQVSTVGQPLVSQQQPPFNPPYATSAAPAAPPGVEYPGNCIHGARTYSDKPARGRAWRRWECAIPWQPNQPKGTRCEPVNVDPQ